MGNGRRDVTLLRADARAEPARRARPGLVRSIVMPSIAVPAPWQGPVETTKLPSRGKRGSRGVSERRLGHPVCA